MSGTEAVNPSTEAYVEQYRAARPALPGAGLAWLDDMRDAAIDRFGAEGFPTPRNENWKYTNLTRLARTGFAEPAAGSGAEGVAPWLMGEGTCHRLVFVNGRFEAGLSGIGDLPDGVTLAPLAEIVATDPEAARPVLAGAENDGLAALNTALMRDGMVLRLAAGVVLDRPVHMIFFAGSAAAIHTRNLVIAGENSRAALVETYCGADGAAYWTNAVTEISVGAGAAVDHVRLQQESAEAYHVGLTRVGIERDGRYEGYVFSAGAALARNEIRCTLTGPGADCGLTGGALVRGRQHADVTSEIDHAAAHTTSRQLIKCVLDDRGRTVFQGRVIVQPDAQKIDAAQSNRNLLLSPAAQADSKPELRIFADDVKCSHGATMGDLDADSMFYLRSRGIGEDEARKMLVGAFVAELLDPVPTPEIRDWLRKLLAGWLGDAETLEIAA